jgi:cell wall-associated NlpC family hydrolase
MGREDLKKRLIHFAEKNLGKPYKYGAPLYNAPKEFDCSSFVQYLFKRVGIDLPRSALKQAHFGKEVNEKKLEVGDLIFIKGKWGHYDPEFISGIGHVAMYFGNGKIIHAEWEEGGRKKVCLDKAEKLLKRKDLIVIKRVF